MDYRFNTIPDCVKYIRKNYKGPRNFLKRQKIYKDIIHCRINAGRCWQLDFMNNFKEILPFGMYRTMDLRNYETEQMSWEDTYADIAGWKSASKKKKAQTPLQFYKTVDNTILRRNVNIHVSERGYDFDFDRDFPIIVDLMIQGYNRYPDLVI